MRKLLNRESGRNAVAADRQGPARKKERRVMEAY
jgi:hypothetical protein